MEHLEIERKFLIRMPDASLLERLPVSEIEQVYILTPEGARERIRRRDYGDRTVYTHTAKRRLSDLTRVEIEQEITAENYLELLPLADPLRGPIRKKRYLFDYDAQRFEIDVFPFWDDRALMELELENEKQEIRLPEAIEIIREVSSDGRYTNSAIAREIPRESIEKEV
ncbi:MAG: hypothetical protein IJP64_03160 [Oscillospiraceae bacterium]|nr:hypothetical protein [Oscillospiraceae bacterium]